MIFAIIGWGLCVIFTIAWLVLAPSILSGLSQFGGGHGKHSWIAPFVIGCTCLYFLFTHAPFHITIR